MVYYSKWIWLLPISLRKVEIFNNRWTSFFSTLLLECPLKKLINLLVLQLLLPPALPNKCSSHVGTEWVENSRSIVVTFTAIFVSPHTYRRVRKMGRCLVHGLVVWGASCGGLGSYLYSEWAEWGLSLLVRGLSWGTGWAQLFPVCEPWLSGPEDTEARRTACLHGACRTGEIGCE